MKLLPDKSIDLILTDPPYGINIGNAIKPYGIVSSPSTRRRREQLDWDKTRPTKDIFIEMFRISKHTIVFGGNYFIDYLYPTNCYIVWDKRGNLPEGPFMDMELAWTNFTKKAKKYLCVNHGFIRDSKEAIGLHPTQKPMKLIKEIINDFSAETDLILDPFLGSGTTAIACADLGRRFIGIEISEKYCEIARQRLRNRTQNLF